MKRLLLILAAAVTLGAAAAQAAHVVDVRDYGYKKVIVYSDGRRTTIWRHHRFYVPPVGERVIITRHGQRGYWGYRDGQRIWIRTQ